MNHGRIFSDIKYIYIYTRVSTKSQVGEINEYNIGIQTQKEICMEYYHRNITEHIINNENSILEPNFIEEVGSSFNDEERLIKLKELIDSLPNNSLILISEISRLGRNIYQVI